MAMHYEVVVEFMGGPLDGKLDTVRSPRHGQQITSPTASAHFRAVYLYDETTQLCHFVGYDVPKKYAYRQPDGH
jgi:hypothetical protein